jgi:polyribonucleotide nucleotidyltransferase
VPLLPTEEEFPYTVRIVSDILESNGSSSMASVCGGAMALMDAGVPLKAAGRRRRDGPRDERAVRQVGGAQRHRGRGRSLRRHGLQGRRHARRASRRLQMDIKVSGITMDIMRKALEQAAQGRLEILDTMDGGALEPRAGHLVVRAAHRDHPDPDGKIRDVIGPGGKTIRMIIEKTGVKIDVEDDGRVNVASADEDAAKKAIE